MKFKPGEQRKFLERVRVVSGLRSEELARLVGIVGRSYRDCRREKLNVSEAAADVYCKKFGVVLTEKREVMIKRWKEHRSKMGEKGGNACYKIYGGFATAEGRKKGGFEDLENFARAGNYSTSKRI